MAISPIGNAVGQAASQVAKQVGSAVAGASQAVAASTSGQATGASRSSTNDFASSVWGEMGRTMSGAAAQAQNFASAAGANFAQMNRDTQNGALKAQGSREVGAAASAGINSIVSAMGDISSAIQQAKKAAGGSEGGKATGGPGGGGDCPNCRSGGDQQVAQAEAADKAWNDFAGATSVDTMMS